MRVLTKYRERHSFEVTDLTATTLVGKAVKLSSEDSQNPGAPIEVPYSDLALIEVGHVSAMRTTGAVALILVVSGMAVLGVVGVVPVGMPPP